MLVSYLIAVPALADGDSDRGRELSTKTYACASCHGANFDKPIDPSYPKLAGQHYTYLVHALSAYKDSNNPTFGRSNPIMGAQAKPLSRQDILDISAYLASLPGTIVTHK